MIGKQRFKFEDKLVNGNGIIRAFDAEININELLDTSNMEIKSNTWWKFC